MQPDIHRRRVVLVAGIVQFVRKLFARGKAAVEIENFQQIDDRMFPVEMFVMFRSEAGEHGIDIDGRARRRR